MPLAATFLAFSRARAHPRQRSITTLRERKKKEKAL
jgi:hypothetical protein